MFPIPENTGGHQGFPLSRCMNSINIKITKLDLKLKVKVKLEITCGMKVKIILSNYLLKTTNRKVLTVD